MIEKVETGKLYKSYWGGIYECVAVLTEEVQFRRVTIDISYGTADYDILPSDVPHEIEREATVEDIENAIDNAHDDIESLRNEIDGYKGSIRDLDEWRDRLEA